LKAHGDVLTARDVRLIWQLLGWPCAKKYYAGRIAMYIGLLVSQVRHPQERLSYPEAALPNAESSPRGFAALWTKITGAFLRLA